MHPSSREERTLTLLIFTPPSRYHVAGGGEMFPTCIASHRIAIPSPRLTLQANPHDPPSSSLPRTHARLTFLPPTMSQPTDPAFPCTM